VELATMIGVGVGDLQHAARAEVQRIVRETKGDELAQIKLLLRKLRQQDLITDPEVTALHRLSEVSHEAAAERASAQEAYFESRKVLNSMLTSGEASPVALALASSAVGSYSISEKPDGSGVVVLAKKAGSWEERGRTVGALIGARWGTDGAAVGAAIGGVVGAAVDECVD
jgi:hypothetical protein